MNTMNSWDATAQEKKQYAFLTYDAEEKNLSVSSCPSSEIAQVQLDLEYGQQRRFIRSCFAIIGGVLLVTFILLQLLFLVPAFAKALPVINTPVFLLTVSFIVAICYIVLGILYLLFITLYKRGYAGKSEIRLFFDWLEKRQK